ncbi:MULTISPECIES: GIY-YIG nuclease family protein [Burkholderia]|uniref:GIY-YIG nuclease family protein n=1 Tax=Burkholderia TaxID=32008 RepID=UPI001CF2D457|nr:GIY-YIG nuclease family protein [Burkholderia cenocepacia]MCA7965552.1 GIY-YIG nuclease family protein [Burkholderia cenocepacia]MDR8059627.1 GIY-YIG nuclease family protein [Burkholderia cenocepacia]MDR8060000.1 GIY-YIG nuclease family protein [Burkholderia cenocepacia]
MQPFSITLFATTGDPEGIRHVDKSNWSGYGVVFTKELFHLLKQEPGISQAGLYILVGNAAEETIYIGEADPVGDRLKTHVANKEGWIWGVYFFDRNHKIGKTEVQFLESELVALAKKHDRAILLNKNSPTAPTMAPAARATAQAFLADMLLILPMLGINAFTAAKRSDTLDQVQAVATGSERFDTIVVPAREEGFHRRFLGENCWFAVRINAKHISKLKYVVAYQVAPVAAITHIAEIESIVPYNDTGKYIIRFKECAQKIGPIARPVDSEINMQSPRYALRENVLAAKNLDQVWAPSM